MGIRRPTVSFDPNDFGSISGVSISGYKSISQKMSIDIRPLTILAGANSSGKSSIMQPLLLMKQTLEAGYDPGALLLKGPNVKFTLADQLFSKNNRENIDGFTVGMSSKSDSLLTLCYKKDRNKGLEVHRMTIKQGGKVTTLQLGMEQNEILAALPPMMREMVQALLKSNGAKVEWRVIRSRCFLELLLSGEEGDDKLEFRTSLSGQVSSYLRNLIHLPGLRGNPERDYPLTAVGESFPGTFEHYTASVIAKWQSEDNDNLRKISQDLSKLGLTWKVTARAINDTQVEIQVGRLKRAQKGGAHDLVSLADVGFGVSQTLPVVVALRVAKPNQMIYLEQPEIHLHPRAQVEMAQLLVDAALRGVTVVAETHSSLLLLGIQTLVAKGEVPPNLIKLHWFELADDGSTIVKSADLDETGAFGDWPEDFADVELEAESRYLDAAGKRQWVQ